MERQGMRLKKSDYNREGDVDLLLEHMRYLGAVRDEGDTFIVWAPKGVGASNPVQRVHSFLQFAQLVTEDSNGTHGW